MTDRTGFGAQDPRAYFHLSVFALVNSKALTQRIRGVAVALLSSKRPKNFENEKFFLCLKIAEIDMGVNFGSRRTILDITTHF